MDMTEKRFEHSKTLQGEDEIYDTQTDTYFKIFGAIEELNKLHKENDELKQALIKCAFDNK